VLQNSRWLTKPLAARWDPRAKSPRQSVCSLTIARGLQLSILAPSPFIPCPRSFPRSCSKIRGDWPNRSPPARTHARKARGSLYLPWPLPADYICLF
jgi:hypothetical protein